MDLADAANHFNNTPCKDAYTGRPSFYAQLSLYDDVKRDSEAGERRILSVSPSTVIPARRCVAAAGTRWIIGRGNSDTFRGEVIRVGYIAHEATHLATVLTLEQACLNQPGFTAYAGRAWVKDSAYTEHSSTLAPQYHINFAEGEPVQVGQLVRFGSDYHIVRSIIHGAAGTLIAVCEHLTESVIEEVSVFSGVYNPVEDSTTGAFVTIRLVRVRWQSLFEYRNNVAPKFGPADIQLAIAKTALVKPLGASVTLSDGKWKIDSALSEGGVWLCRAVRQ